MAIYLQPYKKYADFGGRASRREYWGFYLFQVLVSIALVIAITVGGGAAAMTSLLLPGSGAAAVGGGFSAVIAILGVLAFTVFTLGSMVPNMSAGVRRLHDRGLSGWFYLVTLIPFVGALVLTIVLALPGNEGDNEFGPDPKDSE